MGEERAAIIDYTYDTNTRRGFLTSTRTPICVDSQMYENSDQDFIMTLTQRSYLPCRFFDEHSRCIVHQGFDSTLSEYLAQDKDAKVTPVMSYEIPNADVVEPETYCFVLDKYKKIIRSLIKFVVHVHKKGKCLKGLCLDNLCISKTKLKVWGVRFKNRNDESTSQDFHFVQSIIVNLLGIEEGTDVERQLFDFGDLLDKLFVSSEKNQLCLKRHWSLLSTKERLQFIKNITYKSSALNTEDINKFRAAVLLMGDKHGWTERFEDPNPKLGPVYDCYHHPGALAYDSESDCYYTNWCILRFCQNMATHLWDHLLRHKDEYLYDHDVEMVILNEFGAELFMVYTSIQNEDLEIHFRWLDITLLLF